MPSIKTPTNDLADDLPRQWENHLIAANKSPRTIQTYLDSLKRLTWHLQRTAQSTMIDAATRVSIEGFIANQLTVHAPATAALRYRSLQQFFRWAVDERIITVSPMERMKPPMVPEKPVAIVPDDALRLLLATCESERRSTIITSKDFANVRDRAILRLFVDTPTRLSEMANLVVDGPDGPDLVLPDGILRIFGKGGQDPLQRHRPEGGQGARVLPQASARPRPRSRSLAVAQRQGPPHRQRHLPDGQTSV